MKRLVIFSFLALVFTAQAQNPFPGNPRKLWLGYQTSAEGLIYYNSGAPAYTPAFFTGPFHYMDTTNNIFYQYDRVNTVWDTLHGNYNFPSAAPSAGDILQDTDGDGNFEFVAGSSLLSFTAGSVIFADTDGTLTEDNSNLFFDDALNYLGIGTSPSFALHIKEEGVSSDGELEFDGDGAFFNTYRYVNNASAPGFQGKKARGTLSSPSDIQNDDLLFSIRGGGYFNGSFQTSSCVLAFEADETWTASSFPARMVVNLIPSGSTSRSEVFRIDNSGDASYAGTGALQLHAGTTAQRPTGADGKIRFNSTIPGVEAYYNAQWNTLGGDGNGIYSGSGSLTGSTVVTASSNQLTINSSTTSPNAAISFSNSGTATTLNVTNTSSGTTVNGSGTSGIGGAFSSNSNTGVRGISTSGLGGYMESASNIPLRIRGNPAATNTASQLVSLQRTSSGGAGAAGLGGYINYQGENAVSSITDLGRLQMAFTNAGSGTEASEFGLWLRTGGSSAVEVLNVQGTGAVQFNNYGSGTFTGTATTAAAWDTNGNMIEEKAIFASNIQAETSTDPTTIAFGNWYMIDVSAGTVEIDLPAGTPVAGDTFRITDSRANAGTNNITIDFINAGDNVHGASTNYIINANQRTVTFVYVNAAIGWVAEL